MNREQEQQVLRDALRVFGYENQVRQLQEEAGEVVAAANQAMRGRPEAQAAFVEELADVSILIDQMKLVHGASFEEWRERKLRRLRDMTMMEEERHG